MKGMESTVRSGLDSILGPRDIEHAAGFVRLPNRNYSVIASPGLFRQDPWNNKRSIFLPYQGND